jgi:hypothetical protein
MALLISVSAATVFAASPHYKRGSPTCTINGTTVTCSGDIAGLGNEDVVVTVSATGTAQPFCSAPGNPANVVPGQNPVDFTATGSQTIPAGQLKNGNLTFSVSATATVPTPTAEQAGCPNPNWNVTISQATITSFTLTIEQPPGTVIDDLTVTGP